MSRSVMLQRGVNSKKLYLLNIGLLKKKLFVAYHNGKGPGPPTFQNWEDIAVRMAISRMRYILTDKEDPIVWIFLFEGTCT